ncbi:MAG: rod shape-determining protein RodA [Spirochaetaceae bacterium]|nr:rod shape-determining protein RodA [Spirochaetaceae bacterium]
MANLVQKATLARFDFTFFLAILALLTISIFAIYSANVDSEGVSQSNQWLRQIVWLIIGLILFVSFSFIDYHHFLNFVLPIFLITLVSLLLVLILGYTVAGAMRWLNLGIASIQPSELGKASVIILLAAFFGSRLTGAAKFKDLVLGLAVILPFVGLIMLQPDFGTAMSYLAVYFGIIFVAGANIKLIIFAVLTAILTAIYLLIKVWNDFLATNSFWLATILSQRETLIQLIIASAIVLVITLIGFITSKRFSYYAIGFTALANICALVVSLVALLTLRPYQLARLASFLNPNFDPQGAGYQALQSLTAIGSGGLRGQGFLQGTHTHLRYLPEQSTDFIFSVIGEEFGLVGSSIIIALYIFILIKLLYYAGHAMDNFGAYLCIGVFSLLLFHVTINIGMVIGLIPITGIPLFLLSYGGSSALTILALLGIASNVFRQRLKK